MKYSQKTVVEAIKDSGGIKKNICAKLGCSRVTLDSYIEKFPAIAEAYIEEKEKLKDVADERLIEQIQMGNLGAIIWYQKTQCRDRGYVENVRQEISGPNGGPVKTEDVSLSDEQRITRLAAIFDAARTRRIGQAASGGC